MQWSSAVSRKAINMIVPHVVSTKLSQFVAYSLLTAPLTRPLTLALPQEPGVVCCRE